MKIYMLWDMEGVSGLFTREQTWFWEAGVREQVAEEGRQLLEADIVSAVKAALEAGADEVIVCDTHHGGGNIRPARMFREPGVTYHVHSRGFHGKEYRLMPGLDESVDGFMLMGHHAKAGTEGAFLPHTCNLDWGDFTINGQSVGELGIEACFAGHWDIPFILAQGDEAARREAEAQFPGIIFACVKQPLSHDLCTGLDAKSAHRLTAQKVAEAIGKLRAGVKFAPFKPKLPMTVALRTTVAATAEKAAKRPGVRRVEECLVECCVQRHADILSWLNGTGLAMEPPRA